MTHFKLAGSLKLYTDTTKLKQFEQGAVVEMSLEKLAGYRNFDIYKANENDAGMCSDTKNTLLKTKKTNHIDAP